MDVATILKHKGRAVATAGPDDQLVEIARELSQRRIGAVVVTGAAKDVRGIVSERDIVRAVAEAGAEALTRPAHTVMTREVVVCNEQATVAELMAIMTDGASATCRSWTRQAGRIVSIGDVVKQRIAEAEYEAAEMKRYIAPGEPAGATQAIRSLRRPSRAARDVRSMSGRARSACIAPGRDRFRRPSNSNRPIEGVRGTIVMSGGSPASRDRDNRS